MTQLARGQFGDEFTWGVAHAAYQVEGAWDADGKGPSIWDTFTHRPRTVRDRSNGDVACDFYHRYAGDTALVKRLGFGAQRFSISWPRVLPDGTGRVNRAGLDFYSRVVDACLERGVEPWVTLYHWDLPEALQRRGGWANRDIVDWFGEYVGVVADALGDRVRHWMIFNEPCSFTLVGHLAGQHAPGVRSLRKFLAAVHHVNLAQAAGARVLRDSLDDADVGTTHIVTPSRMLGTTRRHQRAARSLDALLNRAHLEPNFGLGYPIADCPLLRGIRRYQRDGDDKAVLVDWDFIGVQYYTRLLVHPLPVPLLHALPRYGRDFRRYEITATGWEVQPDGLHEALTKVHAYGKVSRIYVTENGAAFPDHLVGDRIHDDRRTAFYRDHLEQVRRAQSDGVPVHGYFCWSLLDNFEWAEGFGPRFGLVYTEFATQRRIIKDSGRWFQEFLAA
ncbi:MAG: beta-galactosidase [Acidimicrobiales bacterium]|nr:beta-galactosidase [Acidimicrobiales bacterium]